MKWKIKKTFKKVGKVIASNYNHKKVVRGIHAMNRFSTGVGNSMNDIFVPHARR